MHPCTALAAGELMLGRNYSCLLEWI